ncbi:hypothetical protein CH063_01706 [Colletotrichum higginsianum]|uniref:Uncharacterized protein n=1 Tax=Colletotrichum higginsianum (strain IMI 349063) TaxID=759273 RepID=H1VB75_COLHI|nr:hypothetical protein CH063_01706 [Colletotrichum higginsianum]
MGFDDVRCHDTKGASATSPQSPKQVGVLFLSRSDESTIRRHDVDAEDLIGSKTVQWADRGVPAAGNVASPEADSLALSTNHDNTMHICSFVKPKRSAVEVVTGIFDHKAQVLSAGEVDCKLYLGYVGP